MTENKPASRTEALAEALLFAAGDGVSLSDIAIVFYCVVSTIRISFVPARICTRTFGIILKSPKGRA